jgi:voltage-gated potassium channel
MNTQISEPTYVTSSEEMLWGVILVAITMVIHAFGMLWTLNCSNGFKEKFGQRSLVSGISNLILASWLIMFVHVLEVIMWAGFFQWKHCFANFSTAAYFAFLEYTTVGSNFNLPLKWRLLEGMISTAGLLGFAWSTGVLFSLAQEFQDQQMQRRQERRAKPADVHRAPI